MIIRRCVCGSKKFLKHLDSPGQKRPILLVRQSLLVMQVGWENTLSALCRGQGGGGPNMVKSLDPDAPHRTAKQLHDLDQERGIMRINYFFTC